MAITKINTPELLDINTTGAKRLPSGTTAQRPTTGLTAGDFRYNTTDNRVEYYDGAAWFQIDDEALPVACTTDTINYPTGTTNTAYYKMSDATDSTLNGYNGTATSVDFNVQGKFGNAGSFNGSSSVITTSLDIDTLTNYTISMWVNPSSLAKFLAGTINSAANNGIYFFLDSGGTVRFVERTTTSNTLQSTDTISINTWNHLVFVRDGSTNYIYINNGTPVSTSNSNITNSVDFTLGRGGDYTPANTAYYNGLIDQVRIFPTALTAANVTSLYNEVQCVPAIIPSDYFNPLLYTGTGTTQSIDDLTFAPDFVWIKGRNYSDLHALIDSVRGANKILFSNSTSQQGSYSDTLTSFDNNGFTLGADATQLVNYDTKTYVAWNWKAAGFANDFNVLEGGTVTTSSSAATAGITAGTITTGWNVSANRDAGFSIVSYTGTGSNASVGHGLDSAPELILIKLRSGPMNWVVYNSESGASKFLTLNSTVYAETYNMWQNTSPTNSVFTISTDAQPNTINGNYIAYAFRSIPGFSDIGSYIGLGSSANPVIVTGFRPAFVMIKNTTSNSTSWVMADDRRGYNDLYANDSSAEFASGSLYGAHFLSNGFTTNTFDISRNKSGDTYIYLAIAEQVYNANGVTANQTNPFNDGSQVAQYEFEDNATDSQPNGYIGKGGTFNGTTSKIDISSPISTTSDQDFSFSQWVNFDTLPTGGSFMGIWGSDTGSLSAIRFLLREASGGYRFEVLRGFNSLFYYNATGSVDMPVSSLSTGVWYNIVLTYTSSTKTVHIYLNGVELGTGYVLSTSGSSAISTGLSMGRYNSTNLYALDGRLDQVRVYNTVLNPNDVWLLYSETSATSSTLDYPASTGAQALYELEGDATSTSSAAYNGTATDVAWVPLYDGTPTSMTYAAPSVSAPFLKAAEFNGSSSYIETPTIIPDNNFTFSCWVNMNSLPAIGSYQIIYNSDKAYKWYISLHDGGKIEFWNGANEFITASEVITTGQWYNITYTASSTNGKKLYVDGSEVYSDSSTANNVTASGTWQGFGKYLSNSLYLDGSLDQARIFNKALDSGEILQLYNEPNN